MGKVKSKLAEVFEEVTSRLHERHRATIRELCELCDAMHPEDRQALREWVEQVEPLANCTPSSSFSGSLVMNLRHSVEPDEGSRLTSVPVPLVRWVLDNYGRDEVPQPASWHDLGLG